MLLTRYSVFTHLRPQVAYPCGRPQALSPHPEKEISFRRRSACLDTVEWFVYKTVTCTDSEKVATSTGQRDCGNGRLVT